MPEFDPDRVAGWEAIEGGVRLDVRCPACGRINPVLLRDSDPPGTSYPLDCPCGQPAYLVSDGPRTGKDLLDAIQHAPPVPDNLSDRCPPTPN